MSALHAVAQLFGAPGQTWAFVGAGATSSQVNPVANLPSGVAAGDLLVIVAVSGTDYATPAGWTVALLNGVGSPNLSIWYKIAGASEASVTLPNAGTNSSAGMVAYRGINAAPLDVKSLENSTNNTSLPVTTTAENDLLVTVYSCNGTTGTWSVIPAGTTARLNLTGIGGGRRGFLLVDENRPTTGLTTARTATYSVSTGYSNMTLAFKQA